MEKFLRPGIWIVPRSIPATVYNALEKTTREVVDYRNYKSYSAILEYDLVPLDFDISITSEMTRKRGPQMFLLDCLPDFPTRDQAVISKAYAALSTGKASTFAITTRYELERPGPKQVEHQSDTTIAAELADSSTNEAVIVGSKTDDSIQQKSISISGDMTEADIAIQGLSLQDANGRSVTTGLEAPLQILHAQESVNHGAVSQEQQAISQTGTLNQTALTESSPHRQRSREELDWQLRLLSNRTGLSENGIDAEAENYMTKPKSSSKSYVSGGELYSSRYYGQAMPTTVEIGNDSSIVSANDNKNAPPVTENVDGKDATGRGLTDKSNEASDDQQSGLSALDIQSDGSVIHFSEPFGKQIMDATLVLSRSKEISYEPSPGSYRILCWASKYMPHLWPSVIQACMPPGCKIDMGPCCDQGSIQYVIVPPIEAAVKSMLHDVELRESDVWM